MCESSSGHTKSDPIKRSQLYIFLSVIKTRLRLVFPSRTNSKSFNYFIRKLFVETVLDELSAKIHFSGAQKARKNFFSNFFPKSPICRGYSRKFHWLMPLLLINSCTKWLNKENNRNRIFNFNPIIFFFTISLLQYLEADFRKEKYFNVF